MSKHIEQMKASTAKNGYRVVATVVVILFSAFLARASYGQRILEKADAGIEGREFVEIDWADFDDDGDLDLAISGSNDTEIYENTSSGGDISFEKKNLGLENLIGDIEWVDYNNDGNVDLITSGRLGDSTKTFTYKNDGSGNLTKHENNVEGGVKVRPGDYDSDGEVDIVVVGSLNNEKSKIYRNEGGSFVEVDADLPRIEVGSADWADFDEDGDLDLAVSGSGSASAPEVDTTAVYRYENGEFHEMDERLTGREAGTTRWVNLNGKKNLMVTGRAFFRNIPDDSVPFDENEERITTLHRPVESGGEYSLERVKPSVEIFGMKFNKFLGSSFYGSFDWGDADNDQNLELIIVGNDVQGKDVQIYQKVGNEEYKGDTKPRLQVKDGHVEWVDVDRDEVKELILSGDENIEGGKITRIYDNVLVSPNMSSATEEDGLVRVEWSKVSDSGIQVIKLPKGYKGFNVYRSNSPFSDASEASRLNESPLDGSDFVDSTAVPGEKYYYRVATVGWGGKESDLTDQVSAVLEPDSSLVSPADLSAVPSDGEVDLSWNYEKVVSPDGYNIYRSTSPFGDISDATRINESLVSDTSFTNTNVTNGTGYYYRVTAVDGEGNESDPSNQASATPSSGGGLTPPTEVTASAGDSQVSLNWSPGDGSDPSGYNVYRSTSSFDEISNATQVNESLVSGTSFTNTDVTNGTSYFYRVTSVTSGGNESTLSSEVSATPSGVGDQTLAVGGLTIYADQIQNTSGSMYEVSGNVSVDQALFLEGTVTVDTEALSIEGSGEIFLTGVPDEGIVTLYDGPYGFTLPSESSTVLAGDGLDAANTLFSVAGLGVQIGGLEVLDDGVRVEGQLQLPKLLGTIKPEISSLQITESNGLDFTGSIEVEEVELKDGVAELEELSLEYASAENRFTGSASLVTPPFGLMAGTQIIGGRLDSVGVDIAVSPPVPIANTGLGLAGGGGFVSGLVKPPTALGINADITPLTGNTEVITLADLSLKYRFDTLIKGGGRVEIFEQGVGGASLTVSARKAAFEGRLGLSVPTAEANVLEGNLNAGVSRAAAPDVDLLASGGLSATLQIPDIGDGFPYGWISSFAGLPYSVANTENTLRAQPLNATGRFKGEASIGRGIPGVSGYGIAYGVAYDQGNLSASFAENMENLNEELFPMPALTLKSAVRSENRFEGQSLVVGGGQSNRLLKAQADTLRQTFTLQRESSTLVIRVQREAGMPGYTITRPSGRVVSAEGAESISTINYSETSDQNKAFYSIKNPQAGEWSVNVPGDGTEHAIDVIGASPAPTIDLDPPEQNGNAVSLSWSVNDLDDEATVDLYYDRDQSGRDGVPIATDVPEEETSFSWDTSSLPTGTYYVYAVASDGKNAPQTVYAEKPVKVTESGAPMPPEEISASAKDTALVVGWAEREPASRYTVYYAEGEDPSFESRRAGVGDTTKVALDRIPSGRTYHVAVTASDTSGRESRLSDVATATFESQSENNAPRITTTNPKTLAREGESYDQQISATDADGDPLSFSLVRGPEGMSIGSGGEISWSPTPGTHQVGVRASDENGGVDSLRYQLTAVDRQGATARVGFSQPTYIGSQAVGQLEIADPELNGSPSAIDSQQVQVRSEAAPEGIDLLLRETSANSGRFQGSFGLGGDSGRAPTLPVEPVDSLQVTYQDSYPDTTLTASARFYKSKPPRAAPALLAPRNSGVATTQPSLEWSGLDAAEQYRVQIARDSAFQSVVLEETTPSSSLTAGFLKEETTYYWRVRAESVTEGPWSAHATFLTRASQVPVAIERSFDDANDPSDYQLVALPGAATKPLGRVVSGEGGSEWQAFWDTGSSEDYFQKYDGSDEFTFRPGRGFWLTSRQPWVVEDSVDAVALKNGSVASIPLHDGWNIISNPLGKDVAWSDVSEKNGGGLQPLWTFDNSFSRADTFRSAKTGRAFYFLNDGELDSLSVPYPDGPAEKAKQEEKSPLLAITARPKGEERPTSKAKIGFDEAASEGLGHLDRPAPPGRFSSVSLRLKAPGEAPDRQRWLAAERRPLSADSEGGHTFDLRLQTQVEGPVRISASGLKAVESSEVELLHPSTGRSYDLRSGETVTLQETDSTALRLAVGSAAYVQDQADKVVPDEVTLTSYPNPMRKQATLEYTLPEAKEVRLTVYDVLGRRVATLEQGQKKAGRHRARLQGDQLSSGVYFGRLEVGGQTLTQKITVVR